MTSPKLVKIQVFSGYCIKLPKFRNFFSETIATSLACCRACKLQNTTF